MSQPLIDFGWNVVVHFYFVYSIEEVVIILSILDVFFPLLLPRKLCLLVNACFKGSMQLMDLLPRGPGPSLLSVCEACHKRGVMSIFIKFSTNAVLLEVCKKHGNFHIFATFSNSPLEEVW